MRTAVFRAPLLWVNLLLGNLVVFLVYGESGREALLGVASMIPYTVAALVLFPLVYKRIAALTPWWLVAVWGLVLSFAIPVLGGSLWGMGFGAADMVRYGSGPAEMFKGGLGGLFLSMIMSVYLAPPFVAINVLGFFLRRRGLRLAAAPDGKESAAGRQGDGCCAGVPENPIP